jgi:hypothetical protein
MFHAMGMGSLPFGSRSVHGNIISWWAKPVTRL